MKMNQECNQTIETSSTNSKHHLRIMQEIGIVCTLTNRVPDLHSAEGWKTVKSEFLTYLNPHR